jgi:hypothetical protein
MDASTGGLMFSILIGTPLLFDTGHESDNSNRLGEIFLAS